MIQESFQFPIYLHIYIYLSKKILMEAFQKYHMASDFFSKIAAT